MNSKQRGITLMGFIMVLMVVAVFALVSFKLVPIYSEFFSVKSAMRGLSQDGVGAKDISAIQQALQHRFDIDYVDTVKASQTKIVPGTGGKQLSINYEVRTPFVYNIDFVVKFDYAVDL